MKVLLICKALHFTYKGGIQTHVWELSQSLIDQGLEVHILAGSRPAFRVKSREVDGRKIIELPTLPGYRVRWFANTIDEISFNIQVVRWLLRHAEEYDVIHFHGRSGMAWPVFFPSRLSNCLLTVHGLTEEEWRHNRKTFDRWIHARISNWAEKRAVRSLPIIIAVSLDQANRIHERFGRSRLSIKMIPNGITQKDYSPSPRSKTIAFVGRMELIKGVDILPGLLARLDKEVTLIMVGKGPERHSLERSFRRSGLTERVTWTGDIEPEAVMEVLEGCDLLILPSRYEPQGRVVLEAMSIGRPFVASRVGGIQDMLRSGKEGILVDCNNLEEVSRYVNQILQDPDHAQAMGINGRKTVRQFYSWEILGSDIHSVYRSLLPLSATKQSALTE